MIGQLLRKYRNDILLLAGLLLLCGLIFVCSGLFRSPGTTVTVEEDGRVLAVLPLNEDREMTFTFGGSEEEYNTVCIKNGKVFVSSASCPDKICVFHRPIEKNGETIVCLPHRLVLTVGREREDADED